MDTLLKIIFIVLLIVLAYIASLYLTGKRSRVHAGGCDTCKSGGCPFCGKQSGGCDKCASGGCPHCGGALSPDAKDIIKISTRVQGGGSIRKKTVGAGANAVESGDQNKVAEYLMKAAHSNDDDVAIELKSLKNDIINIIRAYPGLVGYVCDIKADTDNKNI